MTKRSVLLGLLMTVALGSVLHRVHAQAPQAPQETALVEAINSHPQDVAAYLDLAKYYVAAHRYSDAQAQLAKAASLLTELQTGTATAPESNVTATPITVGGDVVAPRRVKNVNPIYPIEARQNHVMGVVKIKATIDVEGKVVAATVVQSVPMLDQAALDAVKQWEYSPTLLKGVPVPIIMTVTVAFVSK